jgi:hypothetical protein
MLAQPDTELREPWHNGEDQVSGSDTVVGTHKVPVAIPTNLPALATTRSRKGTPVDGPQALVLKRNEIIHWRLPAPTPNYEPLIDAWRLEACITVAVFRSVTALQLSVAQW